MVASQVKDEEKEASFSMRKKEDAAEYKYFPEPDLPVLHIGDEKIDELRSVLPELPAEKKRRYIEELKLPEYDAGILTANKEIAVLFERTMTICGDPKEASNWIMVDLMKLLNNTGTLPEELTIRPDSLGEIIVMVKEGKVSRASGKEILKAAFTEGAIPSEYADQNDLWLISDENVLGEVIDKVLEENVKARDEYFAGKTKNFQFLLGQAMRMTKGKADPTALRKVLEERLTHKNP